MEIMIFIYFKNIFCVFSDGIINNLVHDSNRLVRKLYFMSFALSSQSAMPVMPIPRPILSYAICIYL